MTASLFAQVAQALAVNETLNGGFFEIATEIAALKGSDEISDDAAILEYVAGIPGWDVNPGMIEWGDRNVRIYTAPIWNGPTVVEIRNQTNDPWDQRKWIQVAVLEGILPLGAIVDIVEAIMVSQAR